MRKVDISIHERNTNRGEVNICAHPLYLETSLGHKLPINKANSGNSMCPKALKNMFWVFFSVCIYLLITRWLISILALNTMKIITILLWLVTNGFHVNLQICILHYNAGNIITRIICFCFQPSWKHFLGIIDIKYLRAVMKVSFSKKDSQVMVETNQHH